MDEHLTCKELVELVTDYLEDSLPGDTRARMDRHIAGCDGCSSFLQQMRQTVRLTGQLQETNLTPQQREDLLRIFHGWKKS